MAWIQFASASFEQLQRTYIRRRIGIATTINYLVAYALYGRALCVTQEIRTPEHDTDSLVTRIRTDQQAVFEMLRSGENDPEKDPLKKVQKVGQ